VIESATKYLSGKGDATLGAALFRKARAKDQQDYKTIREYPFIVQYQ
jgi:cystathionine beta-lyase/cystathionine gamma-synthase